MGRCLFAVVASVAEMVVRNWVLDSQLGGAAVSFFHLFPFVGADISDLVRDMPRSTSRIATPMMMMAVLVWRVAAVSGLAGTVSNASARHRYYAFGRSDEV